MIPIDRFRYDISCVQQGPQWSDVAIRPMSREVLQDLIQSCPNRPRSTDLQTSHKTLHKPFKPTKSIPPKIMISFGQVSKGMPAFCCEWINDIQGRPAGSLVDLSRSDSSSARSVRHHRSPLTIKTCPLHFAN